MFDSGFLASSGEILTTVALGICWAGYEYSRVRKLKVGGEVTNSPLNKELLEKHEGGQIEKSVEELKRISQIIRRGARSFLLAEGVFMSVYIIAFFGILWYSVNVWTAIAFAIGACTSILCGWIGMEVATDTNSRTAFAAIYKLERSFNTALSAGAVTGLMLCSLGVLNLLLLLSWYSQIFGTNTKSMMEAVAGYGFGGSSIALFGRVGGGIFTKAADVGADLSGKNEYGMSEDDPRNPACIADNVGDNVGDVAGMGADLFGSLAEGTCAALVIAGASTEAIGDVPALGEQWKWLLYPLMISCTGILVGLLTMICVRILYPCKTISHIDKSLKAVLVLSTLFETPMVFLASYLFLPNEFALAHFGVSSRNKAIICLLCGLWSGLIIGFTTEYYTSYAYAPVRRIAASQTVSSATGIIYGLALGYMSVVIPVIFIGGTITTSFLLAGMYGVSLGALGMLSTLCMGLAIDVYGPIADNAGGLAEMCGLGEDVREITDALDAAGNTTAAIGKGFAIGSAAMVSVALFGAFTVRANITVVNAINPWVFFGLIIGAMLPYAFSALTMKSVGMAANEMVVECLAQMKGIVERNETPDYDRCIAISTRASLKEMILPGLMVILSPIVMGMTFGKEATAGLLVGALVSGIQVAISMSNTGGAWDNAKKFIEKDGLGPEHGKGSSAHKAAVTGDTVGDPMKDTSGPSINIVVKLTAITALVFGDLIADWSSPDGGPFWY